MLVVWIRWTSIWSRKSKHLEIPCRKQHFRKSPNLAHTWTWYHGARAWSIIFPAKPKRSGDFTNGSAISWLPQMSWDRRNSWWANSRQKTKRRNAWNKLEDMRPPNPSKLYTNCGQKSSPMPSKIVACRSSANRLDDPNPVIQLVLTCQRF